MMVLMEGGREGGMGGGYEHVAGGEGEGKKDSGGEG